MHAKRPRKNSRMFHRLFAYFVKADDAIPDHFADGFDDDHHEFKQLETQLGEMLDHFSVWRRRHPRPRPWAGIPGGAQGLFRWRRPPRCR